MPVGMRTRSSVYSVYSVGSGLGRLPNQLTRRRENAKGKWKTLKTGSRLVRHERRQPAKRKRKQNCSRAFALLREPCIEGPTKDTKWIERRGGARIQESGAKRRSENPESS